MSLSRSARWLIPMIITALPGLGLAGGFSTSFVDVLVRNVPLGVPHSVEDDQGRGIILYNAEKTAITVHLAPEIPAPDELRGGAEPIADVGWIHIEPAELLIPSGEEVECRLRLEIPRKRRYRGRLYQAAIVMYAIPKSDNPGGIRIRGALKSRLRIETAAH